MSKLFTRPQFRDQVRRLMQIVPPVDKGLGNEGDQPTYAPAPSNSTINDQIQNAISDINRETGFHVTSYSVPVSAQAAATLGPFALSLADLTPNTQGGTVVSPTAVITDVRRVLFTPGGTGTVPALLQPTSRDAVDRAGFTYFANTPGVPTAYFIEGYVLYAYPAQSMAGVFTLTCGSGVLGLQTEVDTLDGVPIDFQQVFLYQTVVRLSKLSTLDVEARDRAALFTPDAERGIAQFSAWKDGGANNVQPSLGVQSYRIGYGMIRTRK